MRYVTESRFNMWRAIIAVIHADEVVQPHEIHFVMEQTKDLLLGEAQRARLAEDLITPQAIEPLFAAITNPKDREDFFHLARGLSWEDGDFHEREEALLKHVSGLIVHERLADNREIELPPQRSFGNMVRRLIERVAV